MDEFIGTIKMFAGGYEPEGWLFCNGQELNPGQYQALYAVIGTIYGGGGTSKFMLPDLRDRVPMGSSITTPIGTKKGNSTVVLDKKNIPSLYGAALLNGLTGVASGAISGNSTTNIPIPCNTSVATTPNPANNVIAFSNITDVNGISANMYAPTGNNTLKPFTANTPINLVANIPVKLNNAVVDVNVNTNAAPLPISTIQPFLGISFIICYSGLFPARP